MIGPIEPMDLDAWIVETRVLEDLFEVGEISFEEWVRQAELLGPRPPEDEPEPESELEPELVQPNEDPEVVAAQEKIAAYWAGLTKWLSSLPGPAPEEAPEPAEVSTEASD